MNRTGRSAIHLADAIRIGGPAVVALLYIVASASSVTDGVPTSGAIVVILYLAARIGGILLRDRSTISWTFLSPAAMTLLAVVSLAVANVPAALVLTVAGGLVAAQSMLDDGSWSAGPVVARVVTDALVDAACVPLLIWTATGSQLPSGVVPLLIIAVLDAAALDLARPRELESESGARLVSLCAVLSLSTAIGVGIAAGIPTPRFELTLTAAAVPAMVVVFGWLSLLDPTSALAARRVTRLVLPAVAAHFLGIALVALA